VLTCEVAYAFSLLKREGAAKGAKYGFSSIEDSVDWATAFPVGGCKLSTTYGVIVMASDQAHDL
jgi:hypothetical protein